MFLEDNNTTIEDTEVLFEITIANLRAAGDIDERDFGQSGRSGKTGIQCNDFQLLRILQNGRLLQ